MNLTLCGHFKKPYLDLPSYKSLWYLYIIFLSKFEENSLKTDKALAEIRKKTSKTKSVIIKFNINEQDNDCNVYCCFFMNWRWMILGVCFCLAHIMFLYIWPYLASPHLRILQKQASFSSHLKKNNAKVINMN